VLTWARENDCPWGIETCSWATKNGHLGVLRWAREHGCPWNKRMCVSKPPQVSSGPPDDWCPRVERRKILVRLRVPSITVSRGNSAQET
jgi:hypothetical protein